MILGSALVTPSLQVRPFRGDDVAALVALFADPQVARYVDDGSALSEEMAWLWIEKSTANLETYGFGTGAVTRRGGQEVIGWAGIARPDDAPEEIIYGLARAHWGRGFGTELVTALSNFATSRGLVPVRASVHVDNQASTRLLLRAGFAVADRAYRGDPQSRLYLKLS
jgi:ribosomal-protein-alanine N-acetyltransferase